MWLKYYSSFLVYRCSTNFYILILHFATSLKYFVSSNRFLVKTLWFSIYRQFYVCPSNSDTLSLSCLTAVIRTSNIMLNRYDVSGHPCLVLHLRGNAFSFSSVRILAVGLDVCSVSALWIMDPRLEQHKMGGWMTSSGLLRSSR